MLQQHSDIRTYVNTAVEDLESDLIKALGFETVISQKVEIEGDGCSHRIEHDGYLC